MSTSHPTSTMKPSVEEFDVEGAPVPCGLPVFEASAQIRAGFIRKVYGILAVQLLFTVASSAFFMFHTATREWVLSDQTAYSFATIMPIPFLIGLYCHKDRHPLNM
jgi:FtsH-binding integral membrane protein